MMFVGSRECVLIPMAEMFAKEHSPTHDGQRYNGEDEQAICKR